MGGRSRSLRGEPDDLVGHQINNILWAHYLVGLPGWKDFDSGGGAGASQASTLFGRRVSTYTYLNLTHPSLSLISSTHFAMNGYGTVD